MKKQYIAPAIFEHTLRIESQILTVSPIQKRRDDDVLVGNDPTKVTEPDFKQSELNPSGDVIKSIEGTPEAEDKIFGI